MVLLVDLKYRIAILTRLMILDAGKRQGALVQLASASFDLVVIGGGITGAGIFRDAAARGLSVALIEADDFSSGTSSKSSKLIHGGLRYLAMGHVHVVREAALERKQVHRIAPHLAEPRWLMLPARDRWQWLAFKVGVMAYEWLGQVGTEDRHFDLSGAALSEFEPLIDAGRFPRACVYREYLTDDSRLVLANIRAGIGDGGIATNRLPVIGITRDRNRVAGVIARCQLTGEEVRVRGRAVVNAAGPWAEQLCQLEGSPLPKALTLSKGIHVVIDRARLPISRMVLVVAEDRRPVFMIPRGAVVYIGTTDVPVDGPQLWPEVTAEEVSYLLRPIERYCGVRLFPEDCLVSWAGLRPLIAQPGKSTREISRRDEIWVSDGGLITVAGGKLTGYRKMAEDTVARACRLLDISCQPPPQTPLPGGDFNVPIETLARDLAQRYPMSNASARRLVSLYGTESEQILALGANRVADSDVVAGEVDWAIEYEGALSLEDILYRRLRVAYYLPADVDRLAEPVSHLAARRLDWTEQERVAQLSAFRERLTEDRPAMPGQRG